MVRNYKGVLFVFRTGVCEKGVMPGNAEDPSFSSFEQMERVAPVDEERNHFGLTEV